MTGVFFWTNPIYPSTSGFIFKVAQFFLQESPKPIKKNSTPKFIQFETISETYLQKNGTPTGMLILKQYPQPCSPIINLTPTYTSNQTS